MENRKLLTARICTLDVSIREEDVLLAYGFDLLPDDSRKRCDGIAVLLKDRYLLYTDSKQVLSLPLDQVKEFVFRQGIGCVFTEYKDKDDVEHLLCRADMQYLNTFAAVIKEMNRHLEDKGIHYEYEAECVRNAEDLIVPVPRSVTFVWIRKAISSDCGM